ncbi:MAG TPA: hypothetical protein VII32_01550 [Thermoanaerobaculia bacterium]
MKWRLLLVAAIAISADAQTVVWTKFDPGAIRVGRTEPAVLEVQLNSTVSSVALDYAGGGRLNLTSSGPNRWTASVDAAHLLSGYASDDVNHNFVGFLRLLDSSGQTLSTLNAFINVIDANVPAVTVTNLGGGAQATLRILNLHRPALSVTDVQAAAQQFYVYYRDDFDFLSVAFSIPNYPTNRYHAPDRNDVSGIGLLPQNAGALYGSASKLLGITVFPVDTFFDAGETAFIHELGHQWIAYLKNSSLLPNPHWPPSTMARGVMGWNIPPTNQGGDFPWIITPVSASSARTNAGPVTREFGDFDLYLMGFIPPSAVSPGLILLGQPCEGCVIATTPITINDVIQVNGARVPAAGTAKTSFRIATVVISRDRPLNNDEMAVLDYFAARGESLVELPFTSGLARGTAKPFAVATRGIGRLDLRLTLPPARHRIVRH